MMRTCLNSLPRLLLAVGLGLSIAGAAFADEVKPAEVARQDDYGDDIEGNVPGASAIEGRLIAPCCWSQTIDIHDSATALSLRHEIRRRLRNGESAEAIEASLVKRYGPKILGVQPNSPLQDVFIGLSVVMAGAGFAAALMIGRGRKQSNGGSAQPSKKKSETRDKWDDKLDRELDDLDRK
jgi:cytochrome c-type biogenesis protein CcmH